MHSWAVKRTSCLGFALLRKEGFWFSQLDKKPNLYTLLELKPGAKEKEIRYNYYKLIRQYHPDVSTDPVAHAKLLNEAYSILSNDKLRQKYDREHGFLNYDPTKNPQKKQKPEGYSKNSQMDKQYNQAKKEMGSELGKKAEQMQVRMMVLFAVVISITTLTVLISGGGSEKSKKSQPGLLTQFFFKDNINQDMQAKIRAQKKQSLNS